MHMLSKKSSAELETLGRSRNSITMVTANGEVQTSEEAQVDVHNLHLFMTVQILEDTLAALSSGKLCDEHGFTNEWASGKQPRLTKQGKNIFFCKTENVVPMVVPGLSSSSSTSPPQGSSSTSTSTSSSPASERSDELAPGTGRGNPQGIQKIRMTE